MILIQTTGYMIWIQTSYMIWIQTTGYMILIQTTS